ncbi:restriction endonuclease subunit S [Tenacibaculum finnmarkense]|uniref:restriction endonuclease subunit S n=1 Tax=Tenacibaculum finnmarkense TaxID=2781243 RepID=UPI001E600F4F|nr:restriction endonuclease subunit S [Tenacibaculum finnmarkense]MCD8444991.1 restriction endonuclease subunit S [Tenacibaculum finnmarkense genomovar ulcerans]
MAWEKTKLDDVLKYEQPTKYIVKCDRYNDKFKTPVLTAGKTFLLGYTDEKEGIFNNLPVIIFDDFTTAFKYVDFPFKVKSSAMKILKNDEKVSDIRFLFYLMHVIKINNDQHKRYWISKYSQLKIPLPSLEIQKKIASILEQADKIRQLNKQLIDKYDALTQSLFLEMFGKYIKDKNCYSSINNLSSFIDYRGKTLVKVSEGIPYITAKSVRVGYFDKTRLDFITKENYSIIMTRGYPKIGDVLFTTEGATMGFTCRIPLGFTEFAVGQRLITLQTNENYNSCVLEFMLNSLEIQKEIFKLATGSAVKGIRSAKFKTIKIPVPPIKLQNQFSERVKIIENQKKQAEVSLQKSEDLFNSLLQKAFKGALVKE